MFLAIETVDKGGLEKGIVELEALQIYHPEFAEMELRAARSMLRLLDFDDQISGRRIRNTGNNHSGNHLTAEGSEEDSFHGDTFDGPILSKELLHICSQIASFPPDEKHSPVMKDALRRLKILAVDAEELEIIVRAFKWSKLHCFWKYHTKSSVESSVEISDQNVVDSSVEDGHFYGLRIEEARSSMYLIKILHQEIDPTLGGAPASLQAALGALHLPGSISDTMEKCDALEKVRNKMSQASIHVAEEYNKSLKKKTSRENKRPGNEVMSCDKYMIHMFCVINFVY
jgi:hypothetical protein